MSKQDSLLSWAIPSKGPATSSHGDAESAMDVQANFLVLERLQDLPWPASKKTKGGRGRPTQQNAYIEAIQRKS